MKNRLILFFVFLCLFLCVLTYSCKKSGNTNSYPLSRCSIINVASSVGYSFTFNYDSLNRIQSIIQSGYDKYTYTYNYFSGYLVRVIKDSVNAIKAIDSITLNSAGLIEKVIYIHRGIIYPPQSVDSGTCEMEYDVSGNIFKRHYYSNNNNYVDSFVWENGDVVSIPVIGMVVGKGHFAYDMAHSCADGDYYKWNQLFEFGSYYFKNSHMVSNYGANDYITPARICHYTYDEGGKISVLSTSIYYYGAYRGYDELTFKYKCH